MTGPVWLNGALVAANDARIDPADRGFLLGDGLFETILLRHGRPQALEAHLSRLAASAALLKIPADTAAIKQALEAVGAANELTGESWASARVTLTRGISPRGLTPPATPSPTLLVTAASIAPPPESLTAITAHSVRRNEGSPLIRMKTLAYGDNLLARREAAALGADDAVMINNAGRVAGATAANVFLWGRGRLTTPPITEGCVPGIMRARLLAAATEAGMDCREKPITPRALHAANCMLLTNALTGAVAVSMLSDRPLSPPPDRLAALCRSLLTPESAAAPRQATIRRP